MNYFEKKEEFIIYVWANHEFWKKHRWEKFVWIEDETEAKVSIFSLHSFIKQKYGVR